MPHPFAFAPIGAMIRASGRSWWQARSRGGRIVSEWDTVVGLIGAATERLPGQLHEVGPRSRWEELSKKDLIGLRLLCPNGQVGELEAHRDYALFQLKVGVLKVGWGARALAEAHIIGAIENDKGDCMCFAWETRAQRLVQFHDSVLNFRFQKIGPLGLDALDLKL